MPVNASEATRRYQNGVEDIGISAYQEAAQQNTPLEAARVLENAKSQNLNINDFATAYQNAYSPNSGGVSGTMGQR